MKTVTLNLWALLSAESGDVDFHLFNTQKELIDNCGAYEKLTEEQEKKLLKGHMNEEHGFVEKCQIVVEIAEDGSARLAAPVYACGGQ